MPALSEHQSYETTKLLLCGDSGTGKTGSLASLVKDGYRLFIEDYDNGLDFFKNYVAKNMPDKIGNVFYQPLEDEYTFQGNTAVVSKATAFSRGSNLLGKWMEGETNMGSIYSWGPNDVLVVDSLSLMSRAAMNQTLAMNNRLITGPEQRDWGVAQNAIESLLSSLKSERVKCNVIVIGHVAQIEDGNGIKRGFPQSAGQALSPRIPQYFNSMLMTKTVGVGANKKRVIRTAPDGTFEVKHSVVEPIPAELPVDTGLATFFRAARNGAAPPQPKAAA